VNRNGYACGAKGKFLVEKVFFGGKYVKPVFVGKNLVTKRIL
jgi:hypothetical protein